MRLIHHHFEWIESTNTWAKENAHLLPPDAMIIVTADGQTAGRGQFKRPWSSPFKQNIYLSFCFFVDKNRSDLGNIPQVLALSTISVLNQLGFTARLKWPNDLLVSQKKIAGILAETTMIDDQLCFILGIGLNVNMPFDLLEKVGQPATSLLHENQLIKGEEVSLFDLQQIMEMLQEEFLKDYAVFNKEGFTPFLARYQTSILAMDNK